MPLNLNGPLVSIIVVNWNYGRFIQEALASVKKQTYPNLQCIVVDDASSDDSLAIIRKEIQGDDRFRLITNNENIGQLGSSLVGLDHATGEFVCFLDSDDYYFPDFISLHVQAHMAAYHPTAFTSSAIAVIDSKSDMIGGDCKWYMARDKHFSPGLPENSPYRFQSISADLYQALHKATFFGSPNIKKWFWSAGSANLIRRQMLELVRPPKGTKAPPGGLDTYFLLPLHALTGTTVIDLPLSGYRMHGANDWLHSPRINNMRVGGNPASNLRNTRVKKFAIVNVVRKTEQLVELFSDNYFVLLHIITRRSNAVDVHLASYPHVYADPELQQALASKIGYLVRHFGLPKVLTRLWGCMGTFYLAKILWRARKLALQKNEPLPSTVTTRSNPVSE